MKCLPEHLGMPDGAVYRLGANLSSSLIKKQGGAEGKPSGAAGATMLGWLPAWGSQRHRVGFSEHP